MDEHMQAAIDEARHGLAEGGIPIGPVLAHQGKMIGRGHNRHANPAGMHSPGTNADHIPAGPIPSLKSPRRQRPGG